jgi:O-antigen/teichoic acid export membrane protein
VTADAQQRPPEDASGGADLRSQAIHGAKWSVLENLCSRGLGFVTFAILARLLTPDAFGLISLAFVVTTLLQLFVVTGVSEAVIQRPTLERKLLDTAFWLSIAMGLVLMLLCIAAAGPVAALYKQPELAPVLRVLSIALLLQALSAVQEAVLRRGFGFRVVALRRILATVAGSVVGITWAIVAPSVWALVAQYLAWSAIGVVVLWSAGSYRPRRHFDRAEARELTSFGLNVLGIRLSFYASENGDNFVIGLLLGPTQLGYYVVGFRIFRVVTEFVTAAMSAVTLPVFSRMQEEPARIVRAFMRLTRFSLAIAVPAFVGGAVLAPYLIPLAFGDGWKPSVQIMQILSLVGLVTSVAAFDRDVLIGVGRVRLELMIALIGTAANLVAFVIGAQWGITGVAIALVIRAYLIWPVRMLALKSAVGLPVGAYLLQWVRPVACGAIMALAMLGAGQAVPHGAQLPVELAVGALVYPLLLRLLAPRAFQDVSSTLKRAMPRLVRLYPRPG